MLSEMQEDGYSSGKAERCRPDYEAQIKGLKEKLGRSETLQTALLHYFNGKRVKGNLAEMLGELVSEGVYLMKVIAEVVAQQEADPEK